MTIKRSFSQIFMLGVAFLCVATAQAYTVTGDTTLTPTTPGLSNNTGNGIEVLTGGGGLLLH